MKVLKLWPFLIAYRIPGLQLFTGQDTNVPTDFRTDFFNRFNHLFNFGNPVSWIVAILFASILLFIILNNTHLNYLIISLYSKSSSLSDGRAKHGFTAKKSFFRKIFPVRHFIWYSLLSGTMLGAAIFIASIWNSYEVEWFIKNFSIIPDAHFKPVHYLLFCTTIISILIAFVWITESFFLGGPWVGSLRIIILIILNCMAFVVAYFMSILIILVLLWIALLRVYTRLIGTPRNRFG